MISPPWKLAAGVLAAAALALLVALANVTSARNEARRARDAAAGQVVTLSARLATCGANVATLETVLAQQGRAITDAAAQAARERAAGQAALLQVEQRNADLLASVGVLRGILARDAPQSCEEGWNAFSNAVGQ